MIGLVLFIAGVFLTLLGHRIFSSAQARSLNQAQRAKNRFDASGLAPTSTPCAIFAYISNASDNPGDVSVIDTSSNTVVATVPVGSGLTGVSVTPDGTLAYVANSPSAILSR